MSNEQESKSGRREPICSVTGRRCTGGCARRGCGGRLDNPPEEAVRWTKSAIIHVDIIEGDIERAIEACRTERGYPGPELREAARLAAALTTALKECLL